MIDLAIIPARGGSKGLPGKNIRPLGGRPLIGWTIAAAIESACFRRILVSTDCPAIADAARQAGADVPFMRPARLASDTASSLDVVMHVLDECDGGSFALLQPTSPFRSARQIVSATRLHEAHGACAVVGVVEAKPIAWTYLVDEREGLRQALDLPAVTRRQDAAAMVQPNGSLYIGTRAGLEAARTFVPAGARALLMDAITSLDIDTPEDALVAEAIVAARLVPR